MRDVGTALRKAYTVAVNSLNVSYEGGLIPLVDEKMDVNITEHDIWMMFTTDTETPNNLKGYWATEIDLTLEVIVRTESVNNKEIVEDVANQLLTGLFPTKETNILAIDSPFKLSIARLSQATYNPFRQIAGGFVVSKALTFRNRITQ